MILDDLRIYRRIALDTNICVYFLQSAPQWFPLAYEVVMRTESRNDLCIPDIVRLELLIGPNRTGDFDEMADVRALLARGSRIEIDDDVIEIAARLRAMTRLRTPDALVAACAAVGECGAIVGNDATFKDLRPIQGMMLFGAGRTVPVPRYIHLDDYVDGA